MKEKEKNEPKPRRYIEVIRGYLEMEGIKVRESLKIYIYINNIIIYNK